MNAKSPSPESSSPALHPAEEAMLRAFVTLSKRERLLMLFSKPKRRSEACDVLNHFDGWDARFVQPIGSSLDILAQLRKAGAPASCHVISNSRDLDGRDMALTDAVSDCELYSFASVLCCVPGKLAFFFGEIATPRDRLLLRRTGSVGAR